MTSPGAHGEGDAVTLCRWERRLGNHHLGWSYRDVREGVTHPVDGEPDLWVALPREQHMRLLARANTAKVAADLMRARAERAEAALEYVVSMWAKPHRGSCGTTLKDAEQCIAGLEMEIDAVVEHARAALSTQRGEG